MSLFFNTRERDLVQKIRFEEPYRSLFWDLLNRVDQRAKSPGLADKEATCEWWHFSAEYLTTAAIAYALRPTEAVKIWLRDISLSVARRSVDDWVGPAFRNARGESPQGHLETAHLSWSLAVILDLAEDVFTDAEREELLEVLRSKGMNLCRAWLDQNTHANNWRCILLAGYTVAAAVLKDSEAIAFAAEDYRRCLGFFQSDGSYGESLQYGNYAMTGLVLTREALIRSRPDWKSRLSLEPFVLKPRWDAASLLYQKPLAGLGAFPMPRSVNFGDSAAIYRPSADNLLHLAVHAKESHPEMAGLARWLFDTLYLPCIDHSPTDRASFGFINDYGFLTMILLPQAAEPIGPEEAGIQTLETFSCGNVIARNSLDGKTVLATRTGGDPLNAVSHLHGDLNSFILSHNEERLLVDPGHSCYRNLIHSLETSSLTHNTCTFRVEAKDPLGPQSLQNSIRRLEQSFSGRRTFSSEVGGGKPVDRKAHLLLAERIGEISVIVSEASSVYGHPIESYTRIWLLCGEHAVFVLDWVEASMPVRTSCSWLLNNRDGHLNLKIVQPDRLVARRGYAGMKIFNLTEDSFSGPVYGFMHDAYHPLPNQPTEGKPGSGLLVQWNQDKPKPSSAMAHAICLDTPGAIAAWHLKKEDGFLGVIEDPTHQFHWKLGVDQDKQTISVLESHTNTTTSLTCENGKWRIANDG